MDRSWFINSLDNFNDSYYLYGILLEYLMLASPYNSKFIEWCLRRLYFLKNYVIETCSEWCPWRSWPLMGKKSLDDVFAVNKHYWRRRESRFFLRMMSLTSLKTNLTLLVSTATVKWWYNGFSDILKNTSMIKKRLLEKYREKNAF